MSEQPVPEHWRFSLDTAEESYRNLSWQEAIRLIRTTDTGDLAAQAEGECVQFEFNTTHAAVLYMGRDKVILRPYFSHRPAAAQDLAPFFCGGCGIQMGPKDEYLARFMSREDGFRLFAAVVRGPALPTQLPDPHPEQPFLPGCEEMSAGQVLEWRPLPTDGAPAH